VRGDKSGVGVGTGVGVGVGVMRGRGVKRGIGVGEGVGVGVALGSGVGVGVGNGCRGWGCTTESGHPQSRQTSLLPSAKTAVIGCAGKPLLCAAQLSP
jgi:hypothetical protein